MSRIRRGPLARADNLDPSRRTRGPPAADGGASPRLLARTKRRGRERARAAHECLALQRCRAFAHGHQHDGSAPCERSSRTPTWPRLIVTVQGGGFQWVGDRSRTATPGRVSLPTQRSRFIDRPEVDGARALLAEGHALLTLTGLGGIGKTRIALTVAASLADVFVAGVEWVDLASCTDADSLHHRIASGSASRYRGLPAADRDPAQLRRARWRARRSRQRRARERAAGRSRSRGAGGTVGRDAPRDVASTARRARRAHAVHRPAVVGSIRGPSESCGSALPRPRDHRGNRGRAHRRRENRSVARRDSPRHRARGRTSPQHSHPRSRATSRRGTLPLVRPTDPTRGPTRSTPCWSDRGATSTRTCRRAWRACRSSRERFRSRSRRP